MKIDIETVVELKRQLGEINKLKSKDITWMRDGKPVHVPGQFLREFGFLGLNNADMVGLMLEHFDDDDNLPETFFFDKPQKD